MMDADEKDRTQPDEISDDATVVRQSQWSWLLYASPWALLAAASPFVDFFTFGAIPAVFAVIIVVPRYLGYKNTAYILTDEQIVIQRGGLGRVQRFDLPISQIADMRIRHGPFGRTLGYSFISLVLKDGRMAILEHVPQASPLVEHIQARMDSSPPPEDDATGQ